MNYVKEYKPKSKLFPVRVLRTFLLLTLIMSLLFSQSACSSVSKEKVPFAQSLERGQSAYIDVVTIIPVYSVNYGQGLSAYITEIVCKCVTTNGSTAWLVIDLQDYHDCIDATAVFGDTLMGSTFHEVTLNTRVHGQVKKADDISAGLAAKTDKMVLEFIYAEKTPF